MLEVKKGLVEKIETASGEAIAAGMLPSIDLPEIYLERPQNPEHGDYASGLSLKLAKPAKSKPMDIAEGIISFISPSDEIKSVVVASPGFINFTLSDKWLSSQVDEILAAGESFGNIDIGNGTRVQVEFVSINPTGPLHAGHGRGAILGCALSSVLAAAGYEVEREYYFNDAGTQMELFNQTLFARYLQYHGKDVEIPVDGYVGGYMVELAEEISGEIGDKFLKIPELEAILQIGEIGLAKVMAQIKEELQMLRVDFDVWFTEKSLYDDGQFDKVMTLLEQKQYLMQKDGAIWFISTALGEDKDNVVVRSSGTPTYFATDIAYHYNKLIERKFDKVIDIWGADHQGHVQRLKVAVDALGGDPEKLEIIIHQLVTLKRGGELVRISKRSGDIITLREIIEEVGTDACRFFFLARSANSQMDFDLELAKKESSENPVYYVQYAHARIASILRLAKEKGIDYSDGDVSLVTTEPELTLIRKLIQLPELIEMAARNLEPHHLTYYAQDLATVFHSFYKQCRVISDDEELTKARLKLVEAAKIVLAKTLHLMGMTAPESM
ncbi:MAG: arginine--tRNA ligase [Dehalococcoidales bacterium]|nr:MAG: arginine--tRNA ligase [Dehalococcoidales bacterium]